MKGIPTVKLPSGETIPVLGQGTWFMGEQARRAADEATALREGVDLGMTLIDTAEMYGSGGAEEVVADAIAGRRDEVFLVSKVLPENATRSGTIAACERSLKRLGTDRIDLYLLHWRGSPKLADTLSAFETLISDGKIRHWGVSNFDTDDMEELLGLASGKHVATNQVLYNPERRGIEHDLVPWSGERGIPVMAYSPVGQGRLLRNSGLAELAKKHGASPAQIVLAWVMRLDGMIAIPKATRPEHVRDNAGALDVRLSPEDLAAIDRLFAPPRRKQPLEMI